MNKLNGYAIALYEIGTELKKQSAFHKDARLITAAFLENGEFINIISSTKLTKDKRKDIIVKSFSKRINTSYINAMLLMIDNNQFNSAQYTFKLLNKKFNTHFGIVQGEIITTDPLSKAEISKIEKAMKTKISKDVELQNIIDKEVLGGVKVVLGDTVFDSTIKGQLNDMKLELMKGVK